ERVAGRGQAPKGTASASVSRGSVYPLPGPFHPPASAAGAPGRRACQAGHRGGTEQPHWAAAAPAAVPPRTPCAPHPPPSRAGGWQCYRAARPVRSPGCPGSAGCGCQGGPCGRGGRGVQSGESPEQGK
ncbi:uncharacterized protein LOC111534945, partial [Piliocolobus tephrosceles]|uniref:uncharacterized protein LOC111534945 n=1 Tax=Piliocolobus tephrosceles TaxID=591936 RepID=UPI000E6B022E